MAAEWVQFRLGDVCTKIGSGATPRGGGDTYLKTGPYALIRSQHVYNDRFESEGLAYISQAQADKLSNVEVEQGDVLLNITGDSVARCCQVPSSILPARVNQHVAIVRLILSDWIQHSSAITSCLRGLNICCLPWLQEGEPAMR
jgi:type I restriction enzyme, S subunit